MFVFLCYSPTSVTSYSFAQTPCVFLGYPNSFCGYHCLNLNTNKAFICSHVRFDEIVFLFASSFSSQAATPSPILWGMAAVSVPTSGTGSVAVEHVMREASLVALGLELVSSERTVTD